MIRIQFLAPIIFSMPRRYYRRRSGNRDKYSIEDTVVLAPSSASWPVIPATDETQQSKQFSTLIVPSIDAQGMRKVKHLTLTFSSTEDYKLLYALVFVPSGYSPNPIRVPPLGQPTSLYEPNQFVMSAGVLDFSGGPLFVKTPLSRNLNSGDSIYLVVAATDLGQQNTNFTVNVRYAITLQ